VGRPPPRLYRHMAETCPTPRRVHAGPLYARVACMKTQQTFSLTTQTMEMVQRLVAEQVAPNQDALVERALADFFLALRYEREAAQFAAAAEDPDVQSELAGLEEAFASADRETWPK